MKTPTYLIALLIILPVCFCTSAFAQAQQEPEAEQMNCDDSFFVTHTSVKNLEKIKLSLKNKKVITLKNFIKSGYTGELQKGNDAYHIGNLQVLADLDNDGSRELILSSFTGGAHCCDEFYIFKSISPGSYRFAAKTFAGDVCITKKKEFIFSFYQQFGYFFTCFACGFEDSTRAGLKQAGSITLQYKNGKLIVVPGTEALKNKIVSNLAFLQKQPYYKLEDDADQDNGLRKEYALNLAEYYFLFERNLNNTKLLFNKYYSFPDAKKVWHEFANTLKAVIEENDFD